MMLKAIKEDRHLKFRMKSISLIIAAAVAVSCFAAPVSASAATVDTAVISKSEMAVVGDSSSHSAVKSIEKDPFSSDVKVESDLGFSTSSIEKETIVEEDSTTSAEDVIASESKNEDSMTIVNPISGSASEIVVEKKSVTVVCDDYITVNTKALDLDRSETYKLTASVADDYKNHGVAWASTNKNVATVSSNGVVTAVGKGTCYITANIKGTNLTVKTKVTVKDYILMEVKTTAYCGCKKCNGKWYGSPTASGTDYQVGRTIAVDKNVIKLGTKVEIDGNVYVAEDTGVKGKHIDIYHDSHSAALKYGVKVKIVKVYL